MKNPVDKETECSVEILDGKQLLIFPSFETNPDGVNYVRFIDAETDEELLYYDIQEWVDDPEEVMGCIMAAIQKGAIVSISDKLEEGDTLTLIRASSNVSVKVEWSDLGEGISGEYNPNNPDDVKLFRFDVSVRRKGDMDYEAVDNASYCTQVSMDTPRHLLEKGLTIIMDKVYAPLVKEESVKRICEKLSWLDAETIGNWIL